MGIALSDLPPLVRALMDQSELPDSMQPVTNEQREKAMERSEKEAQKEISQLLSVKGIEFLCPPMHKRSGLPIGWPDLTFAYMPKGSVQAIPVALEVKVWGQKPRPEQSARHEAMRRNGWLVGLRRLGSRRG